MPASKQSLTRSIDKRRGNIAKAFRLAALAGVAQIGLSASSIAQEAPIIQPGSMAMTGFSETHIPGFDEGLLPGVNPLDETFINVDTATLRIFDVSALGEPAKGQLVNTVPPFEVKASQIGQVFGLAYDDGKIEGSPEKVPNLYATATSLFGIQIVEDDTDEDGRPERLRRGKEGAKFMDGQFGPDGTAGSIWKIDGKTGEATKFAEIESNSGAGLGNITFDKRNRQFFVSDIDNGMIHRLSIDGAVLDSFDHGVTGRPAKGLEPVSDDGSVMDIAGGTFDSEDMETWAYTQAERRVWGLAVHRDRLYYSVEDSLQIWSVGIGRDGAFLGDARWELDVEAGPYAVTDIAFDKRGFMYLAQRGTIENRYDYTRFAKPGKGEVMRYYKESPDNPDTESVWEKVPQTYATGFPKGHQQTVGGLDLQFGYDEQGFMDMSRCEATVVKTGDNLRDNAELSEQLNQGGPLAVHGAQLTHIELVRPENEPPFGSWFFDFDSAFDDPEVRGTIGDVEVWRPCDGTRGAGWPGDGFPGYGGYPGDYGEFPGDKPPGDPFEYPKSACLKVEEIFYDCTPAGDVLADIYVTDTQGFGGDSVKTTTNTPGVSLTPMMQTRPDPGSPFTYEIGGTLPGDKVNLGMCFYKDADAKKGGYFPCCKINLTVKTPEFACR